MGRATASARPLRRARVPASMPNWTRRLVFGTPLHLALLVHRADRGGAEEVRRALDGALGAFLDAYKMALDDDDADRLALRLARLPDLVRGFAYAGPNTEATLAKLAEAAGPHRPSVQLGVACAAFLRSQGHNPSPYTERASSVLCGLPAERAAEAARRIMQALREAEGRPDAADNPYEAFRVGLQALVSAPAAAAQPPRHSLSAGV